MSAKKAAKHIPQRTCIACGETDTKRALTRLVRTSDEGVQLDPSGKKAGRGAYLCSKVTCWQKAVKSDILAKALRTTLTEADRERLSAAMPQHSDGEAQKM